jgi:hypothetical protein
MIAYRAVPVLITVLLYLISCSSNGNLTTQKKTDIFSIFESEEDNIKVLGDGWFEVVGKAIIQNISPEQAERKAISNACRDVVEYYCGVEITQRTLDMQAASKNKILLNHFSSISNQTTNGIILDKVVISKEIITDKTNLVQTVKLKVKVGKQKGKKDPYFNILADLNRLSFKEGDKLELQIQSSKDCYITILNICSNDTVYVIFPNQYRKNNFLKAGDILWIPNKKNKHKGLSFRLKLLPDKEEDVEMIKVLATKKNISLNMSHTLSSSETYELALNKLLNWLIQIPRDQVEEYDLQYKISKK